MFDEIYDSREAYLEHHGIKGQRWGIRRDPEQLGHLSAKKLERTKLKAIKEAGKIEIKRSKKALKNEAKVEKARKKIEEKLEENRKKYSNEKSSEKTIVNEKIDVKKLSDDELQSKIKRLQLEKQYSDLMPKKIKKQSMLSRIVEPSFVDAGKHVLTNYFKAKGMDLAGLKMTKLGPEFKKEGKKVVDDIKKDYKQVKIAQDTKLEKSYLKEYVKRAKANANRRIASDENNAWINLDIDKDLSVPKNYSKGSPAYKSIGKKKKK